MRKIQWVFHYTTEEGAEYQIYAVKEAAAPKRTKEAKELMRMLENNKVYTCGYMSLEHWNKTVINIK